VTTLTHPQVNVRGLHRVADRQVSQMTEALVESVKRIRSRITTSLVEQDIGQEPVGLLVLIDERLQFAKTAEPSQRLEATIGTLLEDGAGVALAIGVDREEAARLATHLKVKNPFMQQAAETLTASLIQGVTAESKKAVRQIMADAYRDGLAPAESAKLIRRVIGLTRGQAAAVKAREALSPQTVDAFADKLLRHRARVIARTETMRAANRGQQEAWKAMVRDGLIDTRQMQQVWIVTPDDRLCPVCAPMDGKAVSLGSRFESTERGVLPSERVGFAGETVECPPLHPQCRCTLGAVFGE
jgi:hypothetical protein